MDLINKMGGFDKANHRLNYLISYYGEYGIKPCKGILDEMKELSIAIAKFRRDHQMRLSAFEQTLLIDNP